MECCSSNTICNKAISIGYLKSLIGDNIQDSQDGSIVHVNSNYDTYCPTYSELSGGTLIPIRVIDNNDAANDVDGIIVNPICTETSSGYTSGQVVNNEDVLVGWTRFISTTISADPTSISECGGGANLSYKTTYRRALESMNSLCESGVSSSDTVSTSDGKTSFVISSSGRYGSISSNRYTIGKNGTVSSSTRSDTISGVTTFRGTQYGSSNTSTITQRALTGSYSQQVDTYKVTTALTVSPTTDTSLSGCNEIEYGANFIRHYDVWEIKEWVDSCGTDYPNKTISSRTSTYSSETVATLSGTFGEVKCPTGYSESSSTLSYEYTDPICGNTFNTAITFDRVCSQECCNLSFSATCPTLPSSLNSITACKTSGSVNGFIVSGRCSDTLPWEEYRTILSYEKQSGPSSGIVVSDGSSNGEIEYYVDENTSTSSRAWQWKIDMYADTVPMTFVQSCYVDFTQNGMVYSNCPEPEGGLTSINAFGGTGPVGTYVLKKKCDSKWIPISTTYNIYKTSGGSGLTITNNNGNLTYNAAINNSPSGRSWEYTIDMYSSPDSAISSSCIVEFAQNGMSYEDPCPNLPSGLLSIDACGASGTVGTYELINPDGVIPTTLSISQTSVGSGMTLYDNNNVVTYSADTNYSTSSRSWDFTIVMSNSDSTMTASCPVHLEQNGMVYDTSCPQQASGLNNIDACGDTGPIGRYVLKRQCNGNWEDIPTTLSISQTSVGSGITINNINGNLTYSAATNDTGSRRIRDYRVIMYSDDYSDVSASCYVRLEQNEKAYSASCPTLPILSSIDECGASGDVSGFVAYERCNASSQWVITPTTVVTAQTIGLQTGCTISVNPSTGVLHYEIEPNCTTSSITWTFTVTITATNHSSTTTTCTITFTQNAGKCSDCPCDCNDLQIEEITN